MKKLLNIITLLTLCVFALTCKKKETSNSQGPLTCTYTSWFNVIQNYSIINNTLTPTNRKPSISVHKNCTSNKAPMSVKIGSAFLNSQPLNLVYSYWTECFYSDTIPQNNTTSFVWSISGSDDYPMFTETVNDSFPKFTTYASMPDSISKSNTTTLPLGFTNANSATIYIETKDVRDRTDPSGISYQSNITTTTPSMTLTYDPYNTGASSYSLVVNCYKTYTKTIDGKTVLFSLSSVYKKKIYFKN